MTAQPGGVIPEWTRGDRLRKARQLTGMTTRDFAERIGVSQKTITDAEGDKRETRRVALIAWSMASGVPLEWLETGTAPQPQGPEGGSTAERARRYSKPQPSDPKVRGSVTSLTSHPDYVAA